MARAATGQVLERDSGLHESLPTLLYLFEQDAPTLDLALRFAGGQ